MTSDFEGAPNVALEALALETPVISTPASGTICEMLADKPGCLISRVHRREFAEVITDWLKLKNKATSKQSVKDQNVVLITRHYEKQF